MKDSKRRKGVESYRRTAGSSIVIRGDGMLSTALPLGFGGWGRGGGSLSIAAVLPAMASVLPIALLLPAVGLRGGSLVLRSAVGMALVVATMSSVDRWPAPEALEGLDLAAWGGVLASSVLHGTVIALSAAVPLWGVMQAGGLIERSVFGGSFGRAPSTGTLVELVAGVIFFGAGIPARLASEWMTRTEPKGPLFEGISLRIVQSIHLAVYFATPFLIAGLLVDLAIGWLSRGSFLAQMPVAFAGFRPVALLLLLALVLERKGGQLLRWMFQLD